MIVVRMRPAKRGSPFRAHRRHSIAKSVPFAAVLSGLVSFYAVFDAAFLDDFHLDELFCDEFLDLPGGSASKRNGILKVDLPDSNVALSSPANAGKALALCRILVL